MEMLRMADKPIKMSAGLQHFALYLKMYDQMAAYCAKMSIDVTEGWEVVYHELEDSGCLDLDQLELIEAAMDVDETSPETSPGVADSEL